MTPTMAGEFTKYETRGAYHWDEIAERLPNRYSARSHALYAFFLDEAKARRPRTILDIGCGDAALTHLMSEAAPDARVVGIEPEPIGIEMAERALRRAGSRVTVIPGRGEELPFGDGEVDLVTMCEVIEHIENVEPILAEVTRILSPSGAFLASTPQWQKPELRQFHVREYKGFELAELLERFFGRVAVKASEPGRLQDAYMTNRYARVGLNVVSQLGFNPFAVRRLATPARSAWRQLTAVAEQPR